jgi:hypothetical protein
VWLLHIDQLQLLQQADLFGHLDADVRL